MNMPFDSPEAAVTWYETKIGQNRLKWLNRWERVGRHTPLSPGFAHVLHYVTYAEGAVNDAMRYLKWSPSWRDPILNRFLRLWARDEQDHQDVLIRARKYMGLPPLLPRPLPTIGTRLHEVKITALALLAPNVFKGVHMALEAVHEDVTCKTYSHFARLCGNPVLAEILAAIAQQEGYHARFCHYMAQRYLAGSPRAQGYARFILGDYKLVDEEVQGRAAANRVIVSMTLDQRGMALAHRVDDRARELPGMKDVTVFIKRIQQAHHEMRVS